MSIRVAIYGWGVAHEDFDALVQLFEAVQEHGWEVTMYESLFLWLESHFGYHLEGASCFSSREDLPPNLSFVLSVGGDGTFLDAAQYVLGTTTPIVGVNFGHLGFLTSAHANAIESLVESLENENYSIERRSVIQAEILMPERKGIRYALNDLTLQNGGKAMLHVNVYVDGVYLSTYWSDGVIMSTPTGSTAYSLSVGGPIIVPGTGALLLCPIAPHNLSIRPLVLPDQMVVTLRASGRDPEVVVGLDAQVERLPAPVEVVASRAPHDVYLIRLPGDSFFTSIREKLRWGVDPRS